MSLSTEEKVQDYYGKVLSTSEDLKTSACCTAEDIPSHVKDILKNIHTEVLEKFYGCGSPLPLGLEGKTVLDLGSGSGQDCYVLSRLVGESGFVTGIDMTQEQIDVSTKHIDYHTESFGFKKPNVEFKKGFIDDLSSVGIKDNSQDVVVSNCVLNLAEDKTRVFKEIFRALKPGGELYFSDVFADRRIDEELIKDPVLLGECLSGALYTEDFRRILQEMGCDDYRVINKRKIEITDRKIHDKIGHVNFYSITVRAFKLDLEDRCEDFGHVAYYQGTIPEAKHVFMLDDHHIFETNKPYPVCGNTTKMIMETRFKDHFKVTGDFSKHYGLFDCGPDTVPTSTSPTPEAPASCC